MPLTVTELAEPACPPHPVGPGVAFGVWVFGIELMRISGLSFSTGHSRDDWVNDVRKIVVGFDAGAVPQL
jgi:hypothetical protein